MKTEEEIEDQLNSNVKFKSEKVAVYDFQLEGDKKLEIPNSSCSSSVDLDVEGDDVKLRIKDRDLCENYKKITS